MTAAQLLVARVEPGVVKFDATFFYDIRYSGVKNLRIDLPAELAAEVRNATPEIAETLADPPPDDLAKGNVAWTFTGERELLGPIQIRLSWQQRLDTLEVGKSLDVALPHFQPRGVDRAWGQIVLAKSETIDLLASNKPTGLRPIDPQHDLMPGASVPDAALAFEFQDAWSLDVTATRYQLETVKHTSIERGLLRTVVTRSGQIAVQALYRLRSARQRLEIALPSGVEFDTEPLRINSRPTPLERGSKNEFFVPLAGRSTDEPFLLELRYTLPGGKVRVELPAFADEPAVQQIFVSVFLPQELELVGYQGPWTDERNWDAGTFWSGGVSPRVTDASLLNWVRSGINLPVNPADSFPTDGQAAIFSTLRPEADADSNLRLTTINGKWLHFLIFCGVLALGMLLVRRRWLERGAVLAALLIAILLAGVFSPTLTAHILFGGFWLAIVLVFLVWTGWALYQAASRPALAAAGAGAMGRGAAAVQQPSAGFMSDPAPAAPAADAPQAGETSSPDFAAEPPPESPPPDTGHGGEGGGSHE